MTLWPNQTLTANWSWGRIAIGSMSIRWFYQFRFALAVLVGSQLPLAADDTPKGRPTPIVFSAPKSDTVSSNLNQMGAKSSPLRDLESGLKKPFEVFDTGGAPGGVTPPNQFVPPASSSPGISNKRLKEVLDKRAEESYLLSEDGDSAPSKEDLTNADNGPLDSTSRRPKTSLDRYYDRIDRMRLGPTNQPSNRLDLFGEKEDPDEKDSAKQRKSGGLFDRELSANARAFGRMSNGVSGSGSFFSEELKSRSFGDSFESKPATATLQPTSRTKETRMDEFKRLLDGPVNARSEFNVAPPASSATYQPVKSSVAAPGSSLSLGSRPVGSSYANTPAFSGAVGMPAGLSDLAISSPSLTTPPPPQQPASKPPVPKFQLPRGRF